jgi:hypothetical protein
MPQNSLTRLTKRDTSLSTIRKEPHGCVPCGSFFYENEISMPGKGLSAGTHIRHQRVRVQLSGAETELQAPNPVQGRMTIHPASQGSVHAHQPPPLGGLNSYPQDGQWTCPCGAWAAQAVRAIVRSKAASKREVFFIFFLLICGAPDLIHCSPWSYINYSRLNRRLKGPKRKKRESGPPLRAACR